MSGRGTGRGIVRQKCTASPAALGSCGAPLGVAGVAGGGGQGGNWIGCCHMRRLGVDPGAAGPNPMHGPSGPATTYQARVAGGAGAPPLGSGALAGGGVGAGVPGTTYPPPQLTEVPNRP